MNIENTTVSGVVEVESDALTLVSSTNFGFMKTDWDEDLHGVFGDGTSPGDFPFNYGEAQDHRIFVQELRLLSNSDGPLQWLAGAYYLNRHIDFAGSIHSPRQWVENAGIDISNIPSLPSPRYKSTDRVDLDPNVLIRTNNEIALFGELSYQLTDTLSLTAGLRYTEVEYINHTTDQGSVSTVLGMLINGDTGVATSTSDAGSTVGTGKRSATTPRVSLVWEPNEAHTIYLTAANGYRRPHPNAVPADGIPNPNDPQFVPALAESDELWNYELGAKSYFLGGRVRSNLAIYHIVWENFQSSANRVTDGYPFMVNGGDIEAQGIELEVDARPSENLELGFSLTLADTEVVKLTPAQAAISGYVLGASTPAPEMKYSAYGQYIWQLNSGASLFARADFHFSEGYQITSPNTPGTIPPVPNAAQAQTDDYDNLNVQIGWAKDKWGVVLYGENILDNDDFVEISPLRLPIPNSFATLRPTTIGLRFDWRY